MATRAKLIPTYYLSLSRLTDWMDTAAPGDRLDYARGPALDHKEPACRLVSDWVAQRLVTPAKRRDVVTGELVHFAERIRIAERVDGPRRIRRDEAWEATPEGRVFLVLVRAANFGLPCPTNAEIAARCDLRDGNAASYRIKNLVALGKIRLISESQQRVVVISDTGRMTADQPRRGI